MNEEVLTLVSALAELLLALAMALSFVRLARGPTLADRVVALDVMATIFIGWAIANMVRTRDFALFDVPLMVAIVAFLVTIAFAHFIERGARDD